VRCSARHFSAVLAAAIVLGAVVAGDGCLKEQSQVHFDRACDFLLRGLYAVADDEYQKLAIRYPKSPLADRALFEAARIERFYLQDFIKSIKTLHHLLSAYPQSEYAPEARIQIAEIYQEKFNDYRSAIAEYEKALHEYGGRISTGSLLFNIGWCHFSMGNFDKAIKEFQCLLAEDPKSEYADDAGFQLAYILNVQGDQEAAEEAFRKFIDDFPESPLAEDALFCVVSILESHGKSEESLELLEGKAESSQERRFIEQRIEEIKEKIEKQQKAARKKRPRKGSL